MQTFHHLETIFTILVLSAHSLFFGVWCDVVAAVGVVTNATFLFLGACAYTNACSNAGEGGGGSECETENHVFEIR